MNLSSQVTSLIDDPYLNLFSLLVFERLTVGNLKSGAIDWSRQDWDCFNLAIYEQEYLHKQRKGE
jgi:hypothetical protein